MAKKQDLIDRLKELYRKRRYDGKVAGYTVPVLRLLIKEEEAFWVCPACGGQLAVMKWNEKADIVICKNAGCANFQSPVRTIVL